jgi:hypothetical protein
MSNGDGGGDSDGRSVVRARKDGFLKVASALEVQRRALAHDQVAIHSLARLMIEAYDFEIDDPDLGYCCKAVSDILLRVQVALERAVGQLTAETPSADPVTLQGTIEEQRQQLFRAHAVVHATAVLSIPHSRKHGDADLSATLMSVHRSLDNIAAELEKIGGVALALGE